MMRQDVKRSVFLPGKGVGVFWARGELSALDRACLLSMHQSGLDTTLFSYEPLNGVPQCIRTEDAAAVLPAEFIGRYPDLSHFSDLFRFQMMAQRDLVWLDMDVLLIGDGRFDDKPDIIVREEQGGLNGAVLYLSDPVILAHLGREIEGCMDRRLVWGESGPLALRKVVMAASAFDRTLSYETFYPIEHYDIWRIFLPEHREFCEAKTMKSTGVHLFNNILNSMGIWKNYAPPAGSFLYAKLDEAGLLGEFFGEYPLGPMRALIENFRLSQNGKALGIKSILREFIPSIARSYRHYAAG